MSSYQQFIENTLASKTTEEKVNQLISIHADVTSKASKLDVETSLAEIVVTKQDENDTSKKIIDPDGSGVLNTSLALKANISDLDTIQTQLSDIFERLVTLEESAGSTPVVEPTEDTEPTTTLVSPNQSFTWANDGVVEVVKLQEEYTQDFKSNNVNKTLVFGASSFNVSLNDSVEIHNHDTSTMLSLGNFYDISINTTDFKMKIDRVYVDISTLANNIIVPDTGSTFSSVNNNITNASLQRIYFGGTWINNFYRVLGASYNADSISPDNFTITNNTGSHVEVDYILHHKSDSDQDITLTFQVTNTGTLYNVKHDAFTFNTNYYTFDDNGDFELNNMTFLEARKYITSNWNSENLQATSTDVNEYGVTVADRWFLEYGILDESLIQINPDLEGIYLFSSLYLGQTNGLKIKDGLTTIEGYIQNKNDFTIYDSEETTSDVYLDFTFDQIDLSDSIKLTAVTQEFLPSSEFKLDSGSVTLDPTITYKIDNVDVTNEEIMIDDLTEITANEFLVAI